MRDRPQVFGTAALFLLVSAVVLTQTPTLDIKTGQWEMTSTTNIGGAPPPVDTSKMTPQQKAAMANAMKGMAAPQTNTVEQCLTKDMIQKSTFGPTEQPGVTCKHTIVKATGTAMDLKVDCTGAQTMTGEMHIEALSPGSTKGSMKMTISNQGKPMTIDSSFTGKWLKAECDAK